MAIHHATGGAAIQLWDDWSAKGTKYRGRRDLETHWASFGKSSNPVRLGTLIHHAKQGGWKRQDGIAQPAVRQDASAALAEAPEHAEPIRGPAFVSHGAFEMRADGLWHSKPGKGPSGDGDDSGSTRTWVSDPFEILGRVRDPSGGKWARLLRWRDSDGRAHTETVSDADLHGEPSALARKLAQGGLRIGTGRGVRDHLVNYINGAEIDRRVTSVERTGWHDVGEMKVFVGPGYTIGAPHGETVILQGSVTPVAASRGTLEGWRETLGKMASGQSRAILAISTAFAGPLLQLTGSESFGVHIYGPSSRGKTTLLQAAASVWGPPSTVKPWRSTANALEASAALANDTLLCLDEIGSVDAREAGPAIYQLFNGAGKGRSRVDGGLRAASMWRIAALSSGEIPMSAKVAEGGRRPMAGQSVRMIDVQADAGRGYGCFDHGYEDGDAGPIANALKSAARENYGIVGPEFLRRVVADGPNNIAEDCKAAVDAFIEKNVPQGADGQVKRVAARFALLGVAGELATSYGLTGWREGEAMKAASNALSSWIATRGGVEPSESMAAISAVRKFIELHGASRFERVNGNEDQRVINRAGYTNGEGPQQEWWFLREVWKADICNGLDPVAVARALAKVGMLRTQSKGLQCKVRIGDQTIWAYVVTASIFDGASDAE